MIITRLIYIPWPVYCCINMVSPKLILTRIIDIETKIKLFNNISHNTSNMVKQNFCLVPEGPGAQIKLNFFNLYNQGTNKKPNITPRPYKLIRAEPYLNTKITLKQTL